MASLPLKSVVLRALNQLHRLHLPVVYVKPPIATNVKGVDTRRISYLHSGINRGLHSASGAWAAKKDVGVAQAASQDKRKQKVRVVFNDGAESDQIMTKANAEKVANNKDLRLVLVDSQSEPHPTYKLMTGKQLQEERTRLQELKKANKKKEPKVLKVTSRISKHDLEFKAKKVTEWLEKGQDVKIFIKNHTPDSEKAAAEVFKFVTERTKDIATVNHAQKSGPELCYVLKPLDQEPPQSPKVKLFTNEELKSMNTESKT